MMIKFLITVSILLGYVYANMAPSYPEPGTVWKEGHNYEITWFNDKQEPSIDKAWRKFKIEFMTGDNYDQKLLKVVARDLDGTQLKSYNWTAPQVTPHSAVYFFKFTNDKGQSAWTTRFGIVGADGSLEKPEHITQPGGAKIPWGVGKLAGKNAQAVKSYPMTPAMATAAADNANMEIAVSNNAFPSLPSMITITSLLLAGLIFLA
ncbi:hypothetical protein BDF20DRAFT_866944 [Mycotypha africana]|uniref:uncharacterized protein n=1 Tax=Mycotypha africana TaxID=64632 RepID=UPI0023014D09|nr:uncharacterized protein BDF20DRAFT_866944 [Mycotypha africana]KAI8982440.1 hypothetical protein BDF20DRAFT_866944 [Mycotypha africana]